MRLAPLRTATGSASPACSPGRTFPHRALVCLALACLVLAASGCATTYIRPAKIESQYAKLDVSGLTSKTPSHRTMLYLKQQDLYDAWEQDPAGVVDGLDHTFRTTLDREGLFALIELAFMEARDGKLPEDEAASLRLSTAVYAAYYLFSQDVAPAINTHDPYLRLVTEFSNRSMAEYILYAQRRGLRDIPARPLWRGELVLGPPTSELPWRPSEIDKFHLAYEFEVKGLETHNITKGMGVPAIVLKEPPAPEARSREQIFLPPLEQAFAATAFLRVDTQRPDTGNAPSYRGTLELYDPMRSLTVDVGGWHAPLETDLTTPLAYFLQNAPEPEAIAGFMDPGALAANTGLFMLQPYQHDKIPVVLIHGLASSPHTWMPMLNGLMGDPALRRHYQFWFFRYPTGNPVLYSAMHLRESLKRVQQTFDPDGHDPDFNRMVLIGHSMGGLLTKAMLVDSGDDFWSAILGTPPDQLKADPAQRALLEKALFFETQPYVSRAIFLATPHRGSEMALGLIGRIARSLVTLPLTVVQATASVLTTGKTRFTEGGALTGIDSLKPDNPGLIVLASKPLAVPHHSIIGDESASGRTDGSDGVVPYSSSHLAAAESELVTRSDHSVHTRALAIREVRRILLLHLREAEPPSP